ncbi:hypothetical protein GIB67_021079 [Kingdonia uniflora]|uniref:Anthranilate synthase n=1 Tax=Kingdonia uniflora TaxID=39325 RepID=A0A7J7N7C8_9MAGN|nr:hypothetical protein GIB67_021079 [Kingdonia uniflora]
MKTLTLSPNLSPSSPRLSSPVFSINTNTNKIATSSNRPTPISLNFSSSHSRTQALKFATTSSRSQAPALKCVTISAPSLVDDKAKFVEASKNGNLIPLYGCIFSDHLKPVLAYRCLVKEDDRDAPSFLFESVEQGSRSTNVGRYSVIGAQPAIEIVAKENLVTIMDHDEGQRTEELVDDPMIIPRRIMEKWKPQLIAELPYAFCDRYSSVEEAYNDGRNRLELLVSRVQNIDTPRLSSGSGRLHTRQFGSSLKASSMSSDTYKKVVLQAKEHILAGDIFQIVLSQRFERRTFADPFEVYRALRVVNPSPYMTYLQARGCILVASSPEILTRMKKRKIVNRPLAGTVRRGKTDKEDEMLEKQLLNDEKQCAEHIMLVDLGRNDVGKADVAGKKPARDLNTCCSLMVKFRSGGGFGSGDMDLDLGLVWTGRPGGTNLVSKSGSVVVEKLMNVERYSHVMHISSTVTGELLDDLTCWDALRAALPVGTVSGAPKVKAMELIDKLEVTRRGPYSGGFGGVSFTGNMDIALALRTIVFPTGTRYDTMYSYKDANKRREWVAHLQSGAGIVADSVPEDKQRECENKAAALARAIDLAESTFVDKD